MIINDFTPFFMSTLPLLSARSERSSALLERARYQLCERCRIALQELSELDDRTRGRGSVKTDRSTLSLIHI